MDIQENHKEHVLKTDHVVFQDVLDGNKTFEIRFNDRDYQVGDLVILKETEFTGEQVRSGQPLVYTGREIQKRISYVLSSYGLHEGWVILGIQDIKATKAQAVQEWISVEDKEPDCGETVLICWSDSPEVEPEKDYMDIDIDTGALYWSNYNDGDEPSHWMPLPKVIELQEPANA